MLTDYSHQEKRSWVRAGGLETSVAGGELAAGHI
jgi:hypothetical protein